MRWVAESLGHWLLAWTLVVMAVSLWIVVLRPRRAALRYGGWLLATFSGAALLPVVALLGPRISWGDLLAAIRSHVALASAPAPATTLHPWFVDSPFTVQPERVIARDPKAEVQLRSVSPTVRFKPATAVQAGTAPRPPDEGWPTLALQVWLVGFAIFGWRLVWSGLRIKALIARCDRAVPDGLDSEKEVVRRALGIRRRVRLAIHPEIPAPLCIGLVRPVVLWPAPENCPMTPDQRLASLTHELAHLRGLDDWVALLAELWRAIS
jgi:hypothetical protein